MKHQLGFSFVELLLSVAILAGLAVTVAVALNPAQRFKDTRDARRGTNVDALLSGIHAYIVDNRGALPAGLSAGMAERQLGTAASGCAVSSGGCNATNDACLDLSSPLATYLKTIPIDPSLAVDSTRTGYSVIVDSNGIVTVKACLSEGSTNIDASR